MEDRNVPEGTQERPRCPCPHPPRIPRGAELSSCCGPLKQGAEKPALPPCPPPHPANLRPEPPGGEGPPLQRAVLGGVGPLGSWGL